MTLNFVARVATKNLGQAMMIRDLEGMKMAFETGAQVDLLDVVFPGTDEHFTHPFEIALTCALPLEGFKMLTDHGARMENMEGGFASVEELFETLPADMEKHWPDMKKIFEYLKSDDLANTPRPVSPDGLLSKAKDLSSSAKDGFVQAFRDAKTVTKAPVSGAKSLFGKFKKS